MAQCEICGNEYDKAFEIKRDGKSHVYDSFECAIKGMAPECNNCGCKIIGHGMEAEGNMYCSAHCAGKKGVTEMQDRA